MFDKIPQSEMMEDLGMPEQVLNPAVEKAFDKMSESNFSDIWYAIDGCMA